MKLVKSMVVLLIGILFMSASVCFASKADIVGKYKWTNTHFGTVSEMEITEDTFFTYRYTFDMQDDDTYYLTVYEFNSVPKGFVMIKDKSTGNFMVYREDNHNKYQLIGIASRIGGKV